MDTRDEDQFQRFGQRLGRKPFMLPIAAALLMFAAFVLIELIRG